MGTLRAMASRARRGEPSGGRAPAFESSADVQVCNTFESMNLKQNLIRGVYDYGFEKPTAIQQRAILPMIAGRDVIAQAQSGTGKTTMLSIASLQVVDVNTREVQVLVMSPT